MTSYAVGDMVDYIDNIDIYYPSYRVSQYQVDVSGRVAVNSTTRKMQIVAEL